MANRKDLEFNLDKFKSGESNVLLITGFVGSGKSTLAAKLAKKYKAQHLQLDWFTDYVFDNISKETLEENEEPGLLAYIAETGIEGSQNYDDFEEDEIVNMIRDYIKFLIGWCKKQEGRAFIIEGMQIYDVFQKGDDFITECPMIIKGTDVETATKWAAKRNTRINNETDTYNYQDLIQFAEIDTKNLARLEKEMSLVEEFKIYNNLWD